MPRAQEETIAVGKEHEYKEEATVNGISMELIWLKDAFGIRFSDLFEKSDSHGDLVHDSAARRYNDDGDDKLYELREQKISTDLKNAKKVFEQAKNIAQVAGPRLDSGEIIMKSDIKKMVKSLKDNKMTAEEIEKEEAELLKKSKEKIKRAFDVSEKLEKYIQNSKN